MQEASASSLYASLDAGSKKRLRDFQTQLSSERLDRVFDQRLKAVLTKFARSSFNLGKEVEYLRNLRADDGRLFCRSIKDAKKYCAAIDEFSDRNYTSFRWNRNYQDTLEELRRYFSRAQLDQLHFKSEQDIWDVVPRTDTHSGWQFILTGLKRKGKYRGKVWTMLQESEAKAKKTGSFGSPMLPGLRTQASGEYDSEGKQTGKAKHKTRVVLMVSFDVIINELAFSRPVQDWMAKQSFYAGGKSDNAISHYISVMKRNRNYWVSLDYSGYDRSISDWLIEDAFDVIKCCFRSVEEWRWDAVVHDFIHKTIISPNGCVRSSKGVPSGSMFTQIIDTVVNLIMIRTLQRSIGVDGDMMIMGDDNLLFTNDELNLQDVESYISKNFGVKVNADKSSFGSNRQDPEFLSSTWTVQGRWRHPNLLVSRLLYPERRREYDRYDACPEQVLKSYILTYPKAMREMIDVEAFNDYCRANQISAVQWSSDGAAMFLSGSDRYRRLYLGKESDKFYGIAKFQAIKPKAGLSIA